MRTPTAAMIGLCLFAGMTAAQAPPPIVSPEILPDGRVTFRLLAPGAASVSVTGDWPGGIHSTTTPMVKDGHEWPVWRVTLKDLLPRLFR